MVTGQRIWGTNKIESQRCWRSAAGRKSKKKQKRLEVKAIMKIVEMIVRRGKRNE
jgi:hypothetical protein